MEYGSFVYDLGVLQAIAKIDEIHNTVLRIIYNKDRLFSNERLLKLACEKSINVRVKQLKDKYFNKALDRKNTLITQIYDEYNYFAGGRTLNDRTILYSLERQEKPGIPSDPEPTSNIPSP